MALLQLLWALPGLLLLAHLSSSLGQESLHNDTKKFLDNLINGTDKRIRPIYEDKRPVKVHCGFHIVSFGSISEISMDYRLSILFREIWEDPRMSYDPAIGPPHLILPNTDSIWTPDIYFPNEKEAKFHDITTRNSLVKVFPNGTIIHSVRITLRLSCPMNLAAFPMDTQVCSVKLESFAYEKNELELVWMPNPVDQDDDLELPQFDFGDRNHSSCTKTYKTTGSYSCLRADFTLHRQFGFFLLQTYIPSMLIVILSWVSFWINMDAVPARISLGVTTVLTMTTQLSGSSSGIPKVSYPKAIDVWLSVCMIFVFASLIEYAFVNALSRKYKKEKYKKTDDMRDQMEQLETKSSNQLADTMLNFATFGRCDRDVARSIDKVSRVIFPLMFAIFNIVYWPVYTTLSKSQHRKT